MQTAPAETDTDITPAEAEAQGYWQMTEPMAEHEQWIMDNITAGLCASGIGYVIVRRRSGKREVWRDGERAGYLDQQTAKIKSTTRYNIKRLHLS